MEEEYLIEGFLDETKIEDTVKAFLREKNYSEYPIVITDIPMDDYILLSSDTDFSIIST